MDLSLARGAENIKGFYKYVSQKRKAQESLHSMINKAGKLVVTDKKADILNECFALVFTGNMSSHIS